jgi:anti-sigma B factor antagonist
MAPETSDRFSVVEVPLADEGITLLELAGELDAHTAPDFEQFLERVVREETRSKLILDFHKLEYISSAGLGVLMGLIEEVRAKSGDMKLAALPDKIFHVLDLLGFPVVFQIIPTVEEAIEQFRS